MVIEKINLLLLPLMRKRDIDMWITRDRECNSDPSADEIGGQGVCAMPTVSLIRATTWRRSSSSRTDQVRTWRRGSTTR